ncbi:MAG: SRPBCC domain-containing protein [Actinomycetota bacterium]
MSTETKGREQVVGWATVRQTGQTTASPDIVYATLTDIRSHVVWGGEQQPKKHRLLSIDAPVEGARVGTEWTSKGRETGGVFDDRSVVTVADAPKRFEYTTQGVFTWKNGKKSTAEIHHEYTIEPNGTGSTVTYVFRTTGLRPWPTMYRIMLGSPRVRRMMFSPIDKVLGKGFKNLLAFAEARRGTAVQ